MLKSHFSPAQDIFTSPPIPPPHPPPPPLHFIRKKNSFHTPNCSTSDRRHITSRCLQNAIPDVSGIGIHAKNSEQHKSNKHCNNNIRKTDIVLLAKLVIWEFFIYCKWGREQLPNMKTNKPFSPVKCELFFLSHEDKIKLVPFLFRIVLKKINDCYCLVASMCPEGSPEPVFVYLILKYEAYKCESKWIPFITMALKQRRVGGGLWFMGRDEEIEPINLLGLIQLEGKYNINILEYNLEEKLTI